MTFSTCLALATASFALIAVPSSAATRNYDCSKAGNANKTACKTVAKPTPAPKSTAKPKVAAAIAPKARNYDCSKPGNANKAACKASGAPTSMAPPPKPRMVAAPATAAGPQGATAKCKDNTYSHSKTHTGACSHHGGVAAWY